MKGRTLAEFEAAIRRCDRVAWICGGASLAALWIVVQFAGGALPLALVALGVFGLAGVHVYRGRYTFQRGLRFRATLKVSSLSSGDASDGSMTPEQIIANGWGSLDVALILVSQGFTIERSQNPHMLCVVAVRYGAQLGHARDLWSPQTTTRKREAKHLSEALGGRYSFHSDDAPSEWPDDWDFERHDLIAWLDASEDSIT